MHFGNNTSNSDFLDILRRHDAIDFWQHDMIVVEKRMVLHVN